MVEFLIRRTGSAQTYPLDRIRPAYIIIYSWICTSPGLATFTGSRWSPGNGHPDKSSLGDTRDVLIDMLLYY